MRTLLTFLIFLFCLYPVKAQTVPSLHERKREQAPHWQFAPGARTAAVNICDTWTFQTRLSSAAGERPADAIQLPGSHYILAGSDSSTAGVRARLLKLNSQGAVLRSKALSLPGSQLTIQRIRLFSDGNLYVLSMALDPQSGETQPLVLRVDTADLGLHEVWNLRGTIGQMTWKAFDLAEGRERHVFVLSSNEYLINVTKLDYTSGGIRWSKTYKPRTTPQPVGIGVEYGDVYVAWNETESGVSRAMMMDIDNGNGAFKFASSLGGPADGLNVRLQSMTMINLRPRVTALQWRGLSYQAVRINYDPLASPAGEEIFSLSGFAPTEAMRSQQNDWGQNLAYQADASGTDIKLIQTYPDNDRTPIRSWQVHYGYPVALKRLILTNDGGNLVVSHTASYPERIVLTKTDSVATLPGCNVVAQPASFQMLPPAYQKVTLREEGSSYQIASLPLSVVDVPVSSSEECKTLYCPAPPQPDSCLRTFFKEYRNNTNSIVAAHLIAIGGGKFLQQSRVRGTPYLAVEQAQLTVLDTNGRLLDSRILASPRPVVLLTFTQLRDGNLLGTGLIGNGDQPGDIYLVKFSPQFSIIWQKRLVTAAPPHFNAISALLESREGDLYCYLADRVTSPRETRTLLKLDASGNPVWMQQYNIGPTIFSGSAEFEPALVELEDGVIVKYNDEDGDYSPYLMRIRKTDGGIVWLHKYQMPGPYSGSNSYYLRSLVADEHFAYLLGVSQDQNVLLKISPDGSVALARRTPRTSAWMGFMTRKQGGRLSTGVDMPTARGFVHGVVELDTNFTILRTQYMKEPKGGRNAALVPFSDSVSYLTGSLWNDDVYTASVSFQKYNFNSSFASCAVNDPLIVLEAFSQPVVPKQISQASLSLPQMQPYDASFETGHLAYSGYYCGNNTPCSKITLKGPALICDSTTTYNFTVTKNQGCDGMVLWKLDTADNQLRILLMTDSLLQVQVRNGGAFKLHARVFASCGWIEDSLLVQATISNRSLDLGKDTSLCPGNTYVVHAGPGFGSYLWQDGSADSVYVVKQPGLYAVQVTSCGTVYKDTVLVKAAPPIPFNLGQDRIKCNADTLHIAAPPGFLNYTWSNNYNISSLTGQTVVVNPLVDTVYSVKAEKTPGCFAYDTVRITVHHSPVIELGRDTSFCFGDSVVLNAGAGFQSYIWNNGRTTRTVTAKAKGAYSVVGITKEGCVSYDTLRVLQVYALPAVNLERLTALCQGDTKTLNAGNFSAYLWQDGSRTKTFAVSDTGTYFVTVTDQNGCRGSDTTIIKTIFPVPQRFLPADTAICSYGKLELKPLLTYTSYLWNTGGTTPAITIERPGLYWLQVQDNHGCKGKDSIDVVPKDCLSGFYVPAAFTPNGDGKNDLFRPLLFGSVKQYQFTVYNRWGQVVFQTSEPGKGWNGKVMGTPQESSVFIWTCTYQLEGDVIKNEKGTVTVIR